MKLNEKYIKEPVNDKYGILSGDSNKDKFVLFGGDSNKDKFGLLGGGSNKDKFGLTSQTNSIPQDWYMPIFNWVNKFKGKHKLSSNGEFFWFYQDGNIMNFRNDGFFSYQYKDGSTDVGEWSKKTNGFIIKTTDGQTFDSDENKWVAASKTSQSNSKTSQLVVVNTKPEEVADGSKLVKLGMKGDIVTKIQELLIKHGFKNISKSGQPDGIYGSRTKQSVYDFQVKNELVSHDGIVGKNTWGKLIQEPTTTKVTPPKLDPKTGLPDNSFGLPKFDTNVSRFDKFGVSTAQQDADLKKLGLKENMKLTDIITGMVQEQGELTPNQRLAMTKGFGPVSAEYADKLVKDGKLAGTPPAGKLPSGVPSMPSLKDVLNPPTATPWGASTATTKAAAAPTATPQPNSLTDVAKGGYLSVGMKGNVVRDMQVLINSLNNPDIKVDQSGVFNQDTLNAVIKLQKMLGVKPKNGKYGIFGPITMAAINKNKAGANDKTTIDPKTGLPIDAVGAMRDKLPKFDTDASRFSKYGVSKAQQDADLKKLGIQEGLIKKIVSKHLHSKL